MSVSAKSGPLPTEAIGNSVFSPNENMRGVSDTNLADPDKDCLGAGVGPVHRSLLAAGRTSYRNSYHMSSTEVAGHTDQSILPDHIAAGQGWLFRA